MRYILFLFVLVLGLAFGYWSQSYILPRIGLSDLSLMQYSISCLLLAGSAVCAEIIKVVLDD